MFSRPGEDRGCSTNTFVNYQLGDSCKLHYWFKRYGNFAEYVDFAGLPRLVFSHDTFFFILSTILRQNDEVNSLVRLVLEIFVGYSAK